MRRRERRVPALETAVFAAALLLSAFVARELWRRRAVPPAEDAALKPAVLHIIPPILPRTASDKTELAVTAVAPIKLTRVQRRRPRPIPVPSPK